MIFITESQRFMAEEQSCLIQDLLTVDEPSFANRIAWEDFINGYTSSHVKMHALQRCLQHYPAMTAGNFYVRQISENGTEFFYPNSNDSEPFGILALSYILADQEILCAVNLDTNNTANRYVTVDNNLHMHGSKLYCLLGSADCPKELNIEERNGKSVRLTIPANDLVCYRNVLNQ